MYKRLLTALQSRIYKVTVSVLAASVLTAALFSVQDSLSEAFSREALRFAPLLLLVFPLTWVNLYCEVKKWHALSGAESTGVRAGFVQILAGICSGFITPNRIGEFAGRTAYLPESHRKYGPAATFTGSFIQGGITFLFGLMGLFTFPFIPLESGFPPAGYAFPAAAVLALLLVLVARRISPRLDARISSSLGRVRSVGLSRFFKAAAWAALRYAVFCLQFTAALYCFGFTGHFTAALSGVALLYFCRFFIPGTPFGELGIRESLSVIIFGTMTMHPLGAVFAGLAVWSANIGVPVLAGSVTGLMPAHERN